MEEHGSPTQDVYLPARPLGSGSSLCSDLRSSPGWELAWWVMALFPHGSWACRSSLLFWFWLGALWYVWDPKS